MNLLCSTGTTAATSLLLNWSGCLIRAWSKLIELDQVGPLSPFLKISSYQKQHSNASLMMQDSDSTKTEQNSSVSLHGHSTDIITDSGAIESTLSIC